MTYDEFLDKETTFLDDMDKLIQIKHKHRLEFTAEEKEINEHLMRYAEEMKINELRFKFEKCFRIDEDS